MSVTTQQTDVNMNVSSGQTEIEAEDSVLVAVPRTEINPTSTTAEADSGLSNPSPPNNYSSPSPASSESSFSNDTSSLSDDLDSSEEENLAPPKILSSDDKKPH